MTDEFKFDPTEGIDDTDFDISVDSPPCVHCRSWKPKKLCDGQGRFTGYILCHAEEEGRTMETTFKCFRSKEDDDVQSDA